MTVAGTFGALNGSRAEPGQRHVRLYGASRASPLLLVEACALLAAHETGNHWAGLERFVYEWMSCECQEIVCSGARGTECGCMGRQRMRREKIRHAIAPSKILAFARRMIEVSGWGKAEHQAT